LACRSTGCTRAYDRGGCALCADSVREASLVDSGIISTIFLIGGLSLLVFGLLTLKGSRDATSSAQIFQDSSVLKLTSGPTLIGLVTSISNPYFWIWWLTAGGALVLKEYELGTVIAMAYMLGHWTADLSWFTAVSGSFSGGKKLLSQKMHRYILYTCGIFLLFFGLYFMLNYNHSIQLS
jgi:threonine/homoserine/homoserine lactone efflux protein